MLIKYSAVVMLAAITFASCKKDDVKPVPASIEGQYSGKYGFGNDAPDTEYKLYFKPGGILEEIGVNSGMVMGQGTWQVNGNMVTGKYTIVYPPNSKYSISAEFNPATNKLTGTWGYDDNATDGGKFELTRL